MIHLIGFPFDGTACFRKGAASAPDAIRAVMDGLETYSPYLDRDTEDVRVKDLGNLPCSWEEGTRAFGRVVPEMGKTLLLGGEHSVSFAPIRRALRRYPNLVVVQLDAHADLRDGYQGYHHSHASIIRRVLDCFGPGHRLIQAGIRSGTREEFAWMREHDTLCPSQAHLLGRVEALAKDRPIYLTVDLDYFDPAFVPGTGTPEPGGETFQSFVSLCQVLMRKNLVGADVVELAPIIDPTNNSSVFAAAVVRELTLVLDEP